MFDRPDGYWELVPYPRSKEIDEYLERTDRRSIQEFLRHFKPDRSTMLHLRSVLRRSHSVSRLTNDEVIDLVVARLMAHELLLRRQPWIEEDHAGGGGSETGQGSSSDSDLPSVPSPKEEAPEGNTFSNNDGAAQAGALAGAAAAGVPFCEECQKAAQAGN
jgi:hypothetical protein